MNIIRKTEDIFEEKDRTKEYQKQGIGANNEAIFSQKNISNNCDTEQHFLYR